MNTSVSCSPSISFGVVECGSSRRWREEGHQRSQSCIAGVMEMRWNGMTRNGTSTIVMVVLIRYFSSSFFFRLLPSPTTQPIGYSLSWFVLTVSRCVRVFLCGVCVSARVGGLGFGSLSFAPHRVVCRTCMVDS